MKKMFKWYFPLEEGEIKEIWKNGILTVDTNVLLDLYRYHLSTRQALLDSLKKFKGRAWLSYQVADEFFKNRNSVILSAVGAFGEAERIITEVKKSVDEPLKKLKSSRIIPDELEETLESAISAAINRAEASIGKIKKEYPNYRKNDPILESICSLFDGSIGTPIDKNSFEGVLKEAKRRKENKIPPGFKDSNKDGDRPYGDYIMWRQILDYVKVKKKPLILVTSEQKEDWWEKSSGQITGPLYELLKEFYQETGQRFLFYPTHRFLEYSNTSSGKKNNPEAVEEIEKVVRSRETPLIKVIAQNNKINGTENASGTIRALLLEASYMFTCSGRFLPELESIPDLNVKLLNAPLETPKHLIRIGTGTRFDFHIHLKSTDYMALLPVGEYIFEYTANIKRYNDVKMDEDI